MLEHLSTFVITLVSAGAVVLVMNTRISDATQKRHHLFVALGIAVGVTVGDLIADFWHLPHERVIRACVAGAGVALIPLVFRRRILKVETHARDAFGDPPADPLNRE